MANYFLNETGSNAIKWLNENGITGLIPDGELLDDSERPIQNSVVKNAFDTLTFYINVTKNGSVYEADKTYAEMQEAESKGKILKVVYDGFIYDLSANPTSSATDGYSFICTINTNLLSQKKVTVRSFIIVEDGIVFSENVIDLNNLEIDVDDELSEISENPVQNKVITEALTYTTEIAEELKDGLASNETLQDLYDYYESGTLTEERAKEIFPSGWSILESLKQTIDENGGEGDLPSAKAVYEKSIKHLTAEDYPEEVNFWELNDGQGLDSGVYVLEDDVFVVMDLSGAHVSTGVLFVGTDRTNDAYSYLFCGLDDSHLFHPQFGAAQLSDGTGLYPLSYFQSSNNMALSFNNPNNETYPTTKAVYDYVQSALYVDENAEVE